MRYKVVDKYPVQNQHLRRLIIVDQLGYESRIYVSESDFDRIHVGDTIELLITVIKP